MSEVIQCWSPFYDEPRKALPRWKCGEFEIVQCVDSGLVYLANPLNPESLRQFYSLKYFEGDQSTRGYASYADDEKVLRANFRDHLDSVRTILSSDGKSTEQLNLLDFGCAYGYFLDEARRAFAEVQGVELNEEVSAVGRTRFQLRIDSSPAGLDAIPSESLDVITMWDVIEHLPAPRQALKAGARALRPGGTLFLTTGDIDSLLARAMGKRWRLVNPPQHISYFSVSTLSRLLDECGFDVVRVQHPGRRVSLRFILYILCYLVGLPHARLPRWVSAGVERPLYINLFDVMFIAARRRA